MKVASHEGGRGLGGKRWLLLLLSVVVGSDGGVRAKHAVVADTVVFAGVDEKW